MATETAVDGSEAVPGEEEENEDWTDNDERAARAVEQRCGITLNPDETDD
ncbi:hypothetical protein HWV07_07065 [Natronomonas salina]|nr:hypothetical protein [Natronomonas salina]QLD88806.1 hypothetical protein HWV07_07065 [Natronomonas salina]